MRLTDEELRDVIARAEEIQRVSRQGDEWNAELAAVIGTAEELGLSRTSIERALSERLDYPVAPPTIGSLVWAKSADGRAYAAEVLGTSDDSVSVRFLRGSDHVLSPDEVRPCALLPGERIMVEWPWWGPWKCTVISYDRATQRVKLSDGSGSTKTFPLAETWFAPQKSPAEKTKSRAYLWLVGVGAGMGALIGSVATALFLR